MSLLDTGARWEPVKVFPEVVTVDVDGNVRTRPSAVGIVAKARFQVLGQSGTSGRLAESQDVGYTGEQVYRMRFPDSFTKIHGVLGAQSRIEWGTEPDGDPRSWSLFGDAAVYNGSRNTQRVEYTVKRR